MLGKKESSMKKVGIIKVDHAEASSSDGEGLTPKGRFAVYVGECRKRFVVPTTYLSHPLFKIMLDKAYNDQTNGQLLIPCTVTAFQQLIAAVQCSNPNFHFGDFVDQFI